MSFVRNFCCRAVITNRIYNLEKVVLQLNAISTVLRQSQSQITFSRNFSSFTLPLRKSSPSQSDQGQDEFMSKGDKVLKLKLKTTRLDGVLKEGLQISKNKIEKAFYEDRIRLNGERPRKKSQLMNEGDEIDLVRGRNTINPEYLDVSRVEVIKIGSYSMKDDDDDDDKAADDPEDYRIPAMLKRYKTLTIQNYRQPFKGNTEE